MKFVAMGLAAALEIDDDFQRMVHAYDYTIKSLRVFTCHFALARERLLV